MKKHAIFVCACFGNMHASSTGGDGSRVFASAFGAFVANIRNRIDVNDVLTMLGNDLDVYDEIAREDEEPQPRRRQRVR